MSNPPDVEQISTKLIYANQWLRVHEDQVRRRDGSQGIYSVVERDDFVVVVPYQNGRITLVEQFRYPIHQRIWEMPMGSFEPARHKTILDVAIAELREETGFTAENLTPAGEILVGPGFCSQRGHVFLATGLTPGETHHDHGEMDMVAQDFPVAEVEQMILNNTLQCVVTVAAFGMLRLRGLI